MSVKTFLERFPEHDIDVMFIQQAHQEQKRHNGTPYYLHLVSSCEIGEAVALAEGIPYTPQLRRGFLYHDCVEDCKEIAWSDLCPKYIDEDVVSWLKPVTKVKPVNWMQLSNQAKTLWTVANYKGLRKAPVESRVIKFGDRIDNLRDMETSEFSFRKNYLLDTILLQSSIMTIVKPATLALLQDEFWKQSQLLVNSIK